MDVRDWIRGVGSDDPETRLESVLRLGQLGSEAREAAVVLVRAAGDENAEVAAAAHSALEDLGPPDPEVCEELARMLDASRPAVAYWAATLLGRCGLAAEGAVESLEPIVEEATATPEVVRRAAWALARIGTDRALECLRRAADANDEIRHRAALRALKAVG